MKKMGGYSPSLLKKGGIFKKNGDLFIVIKKIKTHHICLLINDYIDLQAEACVVLLLCLLFSFFTIIWKIKIMRLTLV